MEKNPVPCWLSPVSLKFTIASLITIPSLSEPSTGINGHLKSGCINSRMFQSPLSLFAIKTSGAVMVIPLIKNFPKKKDKGRSSRKILETLSIGCLFLAVGSLILSSLIVMPRKGLKFTSPTVTSPLTHWLNNSTVLVRRA